MSDTDATQARQDVVADVDEILEHVINANMLSMPYDVYYELFDAVAGLGVKVEKLQAENAKLRELVRDVNKAAHMLCEAWEGSCSKEAEGMSLYAVCPISDTNELCVFGKLHDRMRELGVVVE